MSIAIQTPNDLATWVRTPARREQLALALPEDVSIDQFERLTVTALLQRPDLLEADQTSLWFALLDAAKRGLAPDGRQGVINVYNTKVKVDGKDAWIKKATFIAMIGGVRDELARYGWALRTSVIYSADEFSYDVAADMVTHRRAPLGTERGEIVGAWAQLVRLRDGLRINEVMDKEQIDNVRSKSKTGPLWDNWYPQACEKTVGHRAARKAPLDPKERQRIDLILDAPETEIIEHEEIDEPSAVAPHTELTANAELEAAGETRTPAPAPAASPDDEPGPAETPQPLSEAPAVDTSEINAAADAAASFVPPNGKYADGGQYGPKTLQEILELGDDGAKWLAWALGKIDAPEDYRGAIWAYARVFAPGIHAEALVKKELA